MPTKPVRANALALPAASPHTFVHQPDLRALPTLPTLRADCMTFQVPDDAFHPHLRRGEFAVIDVTDCEPSHGEMFLLRFQDWRAEGGFAHSIVETRARRAFYGRPAGWEECGAGISFTPAEGFDPVTVWWVAYELPTAHPFEPRSALQAGCGPLSDGPFLTQPLAKKLMGRVIGIFTPGESRHA